MMDHRTIKWVVVFLAILVLLVGMVAFRNYVVINSNSPQNWCDGLGGQTVMDNGVYTCITK